MQCGVCCALRQNSADHRIVLVQEEGYVTADVAEQKSLHQLKLSGTKFRQLLRAGEDIPDWFAFKSVVDVLRQAATNDNWSNVIILWIYKVWYLSSLLSYNPSIFGCSEDCPNQRFIQEIYEDFYKV